MYLRCTQPRVVFLLLGVLLSTLPGGLRAGSDSSLLWQTRSSAHFRLHHHQHTEALAERTLRQAEAIYEHLHTVFGFEPSECVDLVLVDDVDSANGLTYTFPHNQVVLYAYPPEVDEQLASFDDWMGMLLTHELVHVFHLDRHSWIPRIVNTLFGKVALPNQAWPNWFTEGLAVTLETRLSRGGRLRNPRFLGILRMAALEGTFLDLGELSGTPLVLPRANAWYVYGGHFVDWLVERHGWDWVRETIRDYGSRGIPYSINVQARRRLGADYPELYRTWTRQIEAGFRAWAAQRRSLGLVEGRRIRYGGLHDPRPRLTDDGSILFVDSNGHELTWLRRRDPKGRETALIRCRGGCRYPVPDEKGNLWYLAGEYHETHYFYEDLFRRDPAGGIHRISHGLRCREMDLHPAGDRAACVTSSGGWMRLEVVELDSGDRRVLLEAAPGSGRVLGQPAWTRRGDRIVYVERRGAKSRIRVLEPASGTSRVLTGDSDWSVQPAISPDDRLVVYSASEDGAFDLFVRDLEGRCAPRRLTRVLGGAFSPSVGRDRVVYSSYHADGFHIHEVPLEFTCEPRSVVATRATALSPEPPEIDEHREGYMPFRYLRPYSWLPKVVQEMGQVSLYGLELVAQDPVPLHVLSLNVYRYPVTEETAASLHWALHTWRPTLSFSGSVFQNRLSARESDELLEYDELEYLLTAGIQWPFPRTARHLSWSLSYSLDLFDGGTGERPLPDPGAAESWFPTSGRLAYLTMGFSFNNTEQSTYAVAPERGLAASVSFREASPLLGSNWSEHKLRGSLTGYLPSFWRHHSLKLAWRGGVAGGEEPFRPGFSLGGYPAQDLLRDFLENTGIAGSYLRGFVMGAYRGDQFQYISLDYRFPLWRIRRGYQTWPIFLRDLELDLFTNGGYAADSFDPASGGIGTGAELSLGVTVSYYQTATLTFGYASGFGEGGAHGVYFLLGP